MGLEQEIQSRFKSEYHKAILNIRYTSNFLSDYFEIAMACNGLTSQQYNVLRILRGQKWNPITISEIKDRLIDKNSDVSRMVSRLEKKNLVKRTSGKVDKRQKMVSITPAGLELVEKSLHVDDEAEVVLKNLNTNEVKMLNELLDKIRNK